MVLLLAGQQELQTKNNNRSITSKPVNQIGRGSKLTTASISNQVAAMSTMKSQSKELKSRRLTEAERQEQPAATSDSEEEDRALKNRRSQSRTATPKMSLLTSKARRRSPADAVPEVGQLEGAT